MTDRPLDEWRDRMIRALGGELTDDERGELETAMAAHPDLQEDWKELGEARAILQTLRGDVRKDEPSFALPPNLAILPAPAARAARPWLPALAAAAGFCGAALLGGGLLLAGLRVDRTTEGWLVRFGVSEAPDPALQAASLRVTPAVNPDGVTRAQLVSLTQALAEVNAARLDEMERRQAEAQAETARLLYQALSGRQQRQYDNLRNQIQWATYRERRLPPAGPKQSAVPHDAFERRER